MNKSIVVYDKNEYDTMMEMANTLVLSGFFADTKQAAQAFVKIQAGKELGLPAFASMTGISIIQGKPVLGANLIATLIKNDPRYDYRIKVATNDTCLIEFYENGKLSGETGFTIQEAATAGLTNKDNWKKYPSDMLFARAISRGARRHSPGIFGGSPVYTPEELGQDTDPDGYIDAVVVEVSRTPVVEDPGWQDEQADKQADIFATVGGSKGLYKDQDADALSWSRKGLLDMIANFGEVTEKNAEKYAEIKLKLEAVEHYLANAA